MSRESEATNLPLSPRALEDIKLEIPTHEAERPPSFTREEEPKRIINTIKRTTDPGGEVASSMPSYMEAVRSRPTELPPSPPARVGFRGFELEPFQIFNPDGRGVYVDATFPWVCPCSILSGTKSGCGVLIGPRHVLTASHVIDWNASNDFVRWIQGGRQIASAFSTNAIAYEFINDVTYTNADDDYAILVLNARVGDSFGFLGAKTYDSDWDNETSNWASIGYAPDISSATPVFQTGFFLDEDDFDLGGGRMLITKTGDFVKGMSGSPVFGFWSNGPHVVGVVSAGGSGLGNFNAIAGGSNLTKLVRQARSQFP